MLHNLEDTPSEDGVLVHLQLVLAYWSHLISLSLNFLNIELMATLFYLSFCVKKKDYACRVVLKTARHLKIFIFSYLHMVLEKRLSS